MTTGNAWCCGGADIAMPMHKMAGDSNNESLCLEAALERHRAFWLRTPVERPLLHVAPWQDWKPYAPYVLRDRSILPDGGDITPGLLDPLANLEPNRPRSVLDGDMIRAWGLYDLCWTEAMLGCRIVRKGPSVWAQARFTDWNEVESAVWVDSSPWLDELLAANRLLVALVKGGYPVAQPLMRGPLDMAAAALPSEMLYTGFYERPEELRSLLNACADIFIAAVQQRLAQTPAFRGGYAARQEWGLWAPGTTVQFQADASRNLSPALYREFMWEIDRRIAGSFEYSIIHTHSGSSHILPVLIEEPELKAIEVTLDPLPYGPEPLSLLPMLQMVQQAGKSLYVSGPMKPHELNVLLEHLAPQGLAIGAGVSSTEQERGCR